MQFDLISNNINLLMQTSLKTESGRNSFAHASFKNSSISTNMTAQQKDCHRILEDSGLLISLDRMISPRDSEEQLRSVKSIVEAEDGGFVASFPNGKQFYFKHVSDQQLKENRPPARQSMMSISEAQKVNSKGPSNSGTAGDSDYKKSLELLKDSFNLKRKSVKDSGFFTKSDKSSLSMKR